MKLQHEHRAFATQRDRGRSWSAPSQNVRLVISGADLCAQNNGGLGFRVGLGGEMKPLPVFDTDANRGLRGAIFATEEKFVRPGFWGLTSPEYGTRYSSFRIFRSV